MFRPTWLTVAPCWAASSPAPLNAFLTIPIGSQKCGNFIFLDLTISFPQPLSFSNSTVRGKKECFPSLCLTLMSIRFGVWRESIYCAILLPTSCVPRSLLPDSHATSLWRACYPSILQTHPLPSALSPVGCTVYNLPPCIFLSCHLQWGLSGSNLGPVYQRFILEYFSAFWRFCSFVYCLSLLPRKQLQDDSSTCVFLLLLKSRSEISIHSFHLSFGLLS